MAPTINSFPASEVCFALDQNRTARGFTEDGTKFDSLAFPKIHFHTFPRSRIAEKLSHFYILVMNPART